MNTSLAADSFSTNSLRPEGSASGHIRALDGLRGLAVVGVVATHVFSSRFDGHGRMVWVVGQLSLFGKRGVDLFFVLSGFLITGILFDSVSDKGYFRKFYARRSLRIFPLYYGTLLVLFALTPLLHIEWHHMNWSMLFYLQNTSVVMPVWEFPLPDGLMLGHFWSLAVEEQFYLVWPLLVFLIRDRKRLLVACGALSMVSLLLRLWFSLHNVPDQVITKSTETRLDSLLCGAALALLIRGSAMGFILKQGRTIFLMASAALMMLAALASPTLQFSLGLSLWAVASAGLIAWCLVRGSVAAKVFEHAVLQWFGRYSYGIYVLHYVAIGFLLKWFRSWVGYVTTSREVISAVSGVMVGAVACLAAYLSFHFYEKHFLKLKHRFEYRRSELIQTYRPLAARGAGQLRLRARSQHEI